MNRPEPNERILWLICGILLAGWIAAVAANFGLAEAWRFVPTPDDRWPVIYRLIILGAVLVLAVVILAWLFLQMASAEARKQADMERRYRYALEEVQRGTLQALTSALDMRDGETYGHSRRVVGYSLAIGARLGLDRREMQTLAWGALLHDLGKIAIPDLILFKPGPLTPSERASMNEHVTIGYQMVQNITFLSRAASVIRHHHERYDGTGYPDGLAGEEIPLLARVFSVADAYDAMTSSRPYRPIPMEHPAALWEIRQGMGRQFCPKVAAAFLEIPEEELLQIREVSFTPLDDLGAWIRLDETMDEFTPSIYRDGLTGTQNRAAWEAKRSQMTLVRGQRLGTLIFMDVDGMKQVNDNFGHLSGDRMLSDLGARLVQLTPDVYRVGGDEFILWFPPEGWHPDIERMLADILTHFSDYWRHVCPTISVSWGVSTASQESSSVDDLVREADIRMYRCKAVRHENS